MNEPKTIELNVLIHFKEYLRLCYLMTLWKMRFVWIIFIVLALYDFYIYFQTKLVYELFISLVPIIILPPFLVMVTYWRARRNMKTLKALNEKVHYSFSELEIRATSASWNSNVDWTIVLKAQEIGGFILLFTSQMTSFLLPTRCFDDPMQLNEFRGLVRTKLGKKAKLIKPSQRLGLK